MVKVIRKDYDENDPIFSSGPQTFVPAPRPSTKQALPQKSEKDGIRAEALRRLMVCRLLKKP